LERKYIVVERRC